MLNVSRFAIEKTTAYGEEPIRNVYSDFRKPRDVAISGKIGRGVDCKDALSIPKFEASIIARCLSAWTFPRRDTRTFARHRHWRATVVILRSS